ncbi:hypothetical protein Undi14_01480 [Undibacterium sp. 14-3-2]|uniref:hypothetical protein n=1 Tax=Undibacterium sp. 14-3-2 TaxID=2800129 RepID=UPI0019057C15|nr:hypothetical protein [Undibacterium sp. 14-3-2]MBK1888688.1 hypothetical protein [Undibacterium sp. 14-3-2]
MVPDYQQTINRLEEIINNGKAALKSETTRTDPDDRKSTITELNYLKFLPFRVASLNFIERTLGKDSPYLEHFRQHCQSNHRVHVERGVALLEEVNAELRSQWLWSVRGIVASEFYADFLTMADDLLAEGRKDPAAVIGGGVLEEHLRRLCGKHSISTTQVQPDGKIKQRKADALNADLAAANVYDKMMQKIVLSALGIRNEAAHGHFEKYDAQLVATFLAQVTDFIRRVPA